jgi:hypothetical protein
MLDSYCKITPAVVRRLASQGLEKVIDWQPYGRLVQAPALVDLVLMVSSLGISLSACVDRFDFGFARETARKAVAANLPEDLDRLTEGLVNGLYFFLDPSFRKRRWDIAIDLHTCPFYGDPDTEGVTGCQKKQGTKYSFAYATAVLIHRRKRYTVGLIPFLKGQKPHQVVQALLDQVAARGLRVRGVALDSGFDSGDVLLLLKDRNLAYVVPLRRKGKGDNRRNACFSLPDGTLTEVEWTTEEGNKPVKTSAVVFHRGRDNRVMVFAFGGWDSRQACSKGQAEEVRRQRQAKQAKRKYRDRFGIETSYRQKNEAKGKTTKKDVRYRLLLEGAAQLLRQAWVHLSEQLAKAKKAKKAKKKARKGKGKDWVKEMTLKRLVDWLADEMRQAHPEHKEVALGRQVAFPKGLDKKKVKKRAAAAGSAAAAGQGGTAKGPEPPGRVALGQASGGEVAREGGP